MQIMDIDNKKTLYELKRLSKTEIFTSKSWFFDNKKTLYELIRVQTRLTMIVDHSVA